MRSSVEFQAPPPILALVSRKDENQMYVSRLEPSRDFLRVANAPMAYGFNQIEPHCPAPTCWIICG